MPPHDEWKTLKHGGLKEFVDHIVSTFGRPQLKPTIECLRGVTTYPSGDQRQGRYNMTLTDLMNQHYTSAVREASLDLILGRSDNIVKVGDLVEMLLGISFSVKDAMLDWEWLGIDPVEWPPQRLDWEVYRIEHLAFVSNMESQFAGWLEYPWHILYSALRSMACQDWQREHLCPFCRTSHRNSGRTHDAWAYFNGCLSHLSIAPMCIGSFMLEDTLMVRGKPMTPPVIKLLQRLSPKQEAREWMPAITIIYMAPGGHRQWPMSITALLERLSWIVLQTRPLALASFQEAVQRNPDWQPKYRSGPKDQRLPFAPAIPYKFLDIGTKMGDFKLGEHVPERHDTYNIYHPRYIRNGIPPVNTFHAVVHGRAAKWVNNVGDWCLEEARFNHSVNHDFRVIDSSGYIWGLPVIVPTCPQKLFSQGPRQKYVDIVTDTIHASSSDLITWNTLVMIKLKWNSIIPRQWLEIATQSLEAWKLRDEKSPFLPDNRRGFARVTPVALSMVGVPNTEIHAMDEFPLHGLGLYDDYEPWSRYSGYVWSGWTTRKAQPMHIDSALQALIDQSVQSAPCAADQTYLGKDSVTPDPTVESKGSQLPVCDFEPPFPTSLPDVHMEPSADKRSRESPDSTLKPEHKSLKTSGVAVATDQEPVVSGAYLEPQTIRWNVREESEVRQTMLRLYQCSPAWRLKACIDAMKIKPIDLSSLLQETGVKFASVDLVEMAASCLAKFSKELEEDESKNSSAVATSPNLETSKEERDVASQQGASGFVDASTKNLTSSTQPTESDAAAPKSESTKEETKPPQQDAVASKEKSGTEDSCNSARDQPKAWFDRVSSVGHSILWPQSTTPSLGPTLLTGMKLGEEDRLVDDLMEWERKLENANLDNHMQFLRNAQLTMSNHPMEATAWENGYVPEAQGLPSDQLDSRIQGSLPPLANMVSRPRQPIAAA